MWEQSSLGERTKLYPRGQFEVHNTFTIIPVKRQRLGEWVAWNMTPEYSRVVVFLPGMKNHLSKKKSGTIYLMTDLLLIYHYRIVFHIMCGKRTVLSLWCVRFLWVWHHSTLQG